MATKFTQSFKMQAVEKALRRKQGVNIEEVATSMGVGYSTLQKWIRVSQSQGLEITPPDDIEIMTKEKRPQDWSLEERLNMVITCGSLSDAAISKLCREKGLFPHHIEQWKSDFAEGKTATSGGVKHADNKQLKHENKILKKELNRKDKALAEAAALLVLQKKVTALWGNDDEDNSP